MQPSIATFMNLLQNISGFQYSFHEDCTFSHNPSARKGNFKLEGNIFLVCKLIELTKIKTQTCGFQLFICDISTLYYLNYQRLQRYKI